MTPAHGQETTFGWSSSALHHPILRPTETPYLARTRHASAVPPKQQRQRSSEEVDGTKTMPHQHQNRDSLFSESSFNSNGDSSETQPRSRHEPPPLIHTLFEELTETWQYVVADPLTRHAVIIDPHLDNPPSSTKVSTIAADRMLSVISQNRYLVDRILHTHESPHHGSSAWYIRAQLLARTGHAPQITVGRTSSMAAVQRVIRRKYSMNGGPTWRPDSLDDGFSDGQEFVIGNIRATALQFRNGTLAFVIGSHIFAGTSMIELELRNREGKALGDLKSYKIYTSKDDPPARKATLMPIYERPSPVPAVSSRMQSRENMGGGGRKLVIKYAAENEQIAELEG